MPKTLVFKARKENKKRVRQIGLNIIFAASIGGLASRIALLSGQALH